MKYTASVRLNSDEIPAIINTRTGEVQEVKHRPNNIPEGKEVWLPQESFSKFYNRSWAFLQRELSPIEFKAAFTLALMAKANTNTLEPLNDSSTIPELMEILNVGKNKVKPIVTKLFKLGVYGKFEVADKNVPYTKFWVLNPYLSFQGKIVTSDIARLFKGTIVAQEYFKSN